MSDFINYVFLYEFTLNGRTWRYTSNAENVIDVDNNVWEACPISDDGIKQSGEATADALTITASVDTVPARLFVYAAPSRVMEVSKYRAEFAEKERVLDLTGVVSTPESRVLPVVNKRAMYVGEVTQCSFPTPGSAVMTCETISASMRREGLRLPWQKQCPYAVYDPSTCRLDKTLWDFPASVISIDGASVTLSTAGTNPDGFLAGGFIEYEHPVKGTETLQIEAQAGAVIVIFGSTVELWAGMSVTAYPGCNQTPDRCKYFDNYPNYGGIESLPGKSPFNGDPVF